MTKIIKTTKGQYKLTKKAWEEIGKQAQWLDEEKEDVLGDSLEEYENFETPPAPLPGKIINEFSLSKILEVIKALGEEQIAGFNGAREDEVVAILKNAEPEERQEIYDILKDDSKQVDISDSSIHNLATPGIEEFYPKSSSDSMIKEASIVYEDSKNSCPECENLQHYIVNSSTPKAKECAECGFKWNTDYYKAGEKIVSSINANAKLKKEAMGLDGQIQSYVKKVKSPKTGKEFYSLILYGNAQPISQFLGKPKKGQKGQEKLFFTYFSGTWSRIIPDSFIQEVITGQQVDDPKAAGFKKSIEKLQQGFDVEGTIYKADFAALFDPNSYGENIESTQQSEVSGKQKEIKDATKQAENAPAKLEALQMFIDAEINRISNMTDEATQSTFVKSFLSFASKFYNYSFGNQILIWIQKPNATMVSNKMDWQKKFGREVVDYGDPITVRIPMFIKRRDVGNDKIAKWKSEGKSDSEIWSLSHHLSFGAGPVYDISATKPVPGWTDENGNGPYEPKDWRQDSNDTVEEMEVLVNATIKWAEKNNINVGFEAMSQSLGGYSSGGEIKINDKFDGINKFSTLIHESAHEVLHWEQGKGKGVRNMMGKSDGRMAKEVDAETTAFIVLEHYGFETVDTPNYLALWRATGEDIKARKQNISESVRLIIQGIDTEVQNIDMSEEQIEEIMEEDVDDAGVDMEKKEIEEQKTEEVPEVPEVPESPLAPEVVENQEEMLANSDDEMLKIAKRFATNSQINLKGNFYGKFGL